MWKAKPFPSCVRVGSDVCYIPRIEALVRNDRASSIRKWAGRVFNRFEWIHFEAKLANFNRDDGRKHEVRLRSFASWLAGRWAAKEATIKAHGQRQLYLRDVSILPNDENHIKTEVLQGASRRKPLILVSPPSKTIVMDGHVAMRRGLSIDNKSATAYDRNIKSIKNQESPSSIRYVDAKSVHSGRLYQRKSFIRVEDCRFVDASISHDGDYAFAVCQAWDEPLTQNLESNHEPVTDDGSGDPIHEPEYGDRGFVFG